MESTRSFAPFEVISEYKPSGDQPTAIADLAQRIKAGEKDVVLLGATGTGKSATTEIYTLHIVGSVRCV